MEVVTARRTLGVPPTAGIQDIERAFRAAARSSHPDQGGDPAAFQRLVEARETLRRPPPAPLTVVHRRPWRPLLASVRRRLPPHRTRPPRVR